MTPFIDRQMLRAYLYFFIRDHADDPIVPAMNELKAAIEGRKASDGTLRPLIERAGLSFDDFVKKLEPEFVPKPSPFDRPKRED